MTESEFRRALRFGLGRAIQFARTVKPLPYLQALFDACVECQTYDPQVDGTLAGFVWEVIEASGETAACRDVVLRSLADCGDDYHALKRFSLGVLFAQEGDAGMRQALYENFRPGEWHGDGLAICLVELDGLEGLLFAAGKLRAVGGDSGWLLSHASDKLGEDVVRRALAERAAVDPDVAWFLALSAPAAAQLPAKAAPEVSLGAVLAGRVTVAAATKWGRGAPGEEIQQAAEALASGSRPAEESLLAAFGQRAFPGDPQPLLARAGAGEHRVKSLALRALSQVAHPAVRMFGLAQQEVDLIGRNFLPGDHALILTWLEEVTGDEQLHRMAMDALDFWKIHPAAESEPAMLRLIYQRTPCGQCRESAVRRMIERHRLPSEIEAECAFDGHDEIRELVKNFGSVEFNAPSPAPEDTR